MHVFAIGSPDLSKYLLTRNSTIPCCYFIYLNIIALIKNGKILLFYREPDWRPKSNYRYPPLLSRTSPSNPFPFTTSEEKKKITESSSESTPNPFTFSTTNPKKPMTSSKHHLTSQKPSEATTAVNHMLVSLQKLQRVQIALASKDEASNAGDRATEEALVKSCLAEVEALREQVLANVPTRSRARILQGLEGNVATLTEVPLLIGRCFNLSLNLKIIGGSLATPNLDPTIAGRIIFDLLILQQSLAYLDLHKEEVREEKRVDSLMSELKLESGGFGANGRPRLRLA